MKETGLLVLDAHKNTFDIYRTAAWLRKQHRSSVIHMPVAAYIFCIPLLKQMLYFFGKLYSVTLYPVYRADEFKPSTVKTKILTLCLRSSITEAQSKIENEKYLKKVMRAINIPDQIVVLSPYGGIANYGGKIKHGVRMLIATKPKIIIAKTGFKTRHVSISFEGMSRTQTRDHLLKGFELI